MASRVRRLRQGPRLRPQRALVKKKTNRRWNPNIQRVRADRCPAPPRSSTCAPRASRPARSPADPLTLTRRQDLSLRGQVLLVFFFWCPPSVVAEVARAQRVEHPGSSIVDGTAGVRPSAIPRIVLRRILPDRVFGSAGTTSTSPERRDRRRSRPAPRHQLGRQSPASMSDARLEHDEPARHLALELRRRRRSPRTRRPPGGAASTASIAPVDSRCPATLITSSVRPITYR